jgi:hypothetical protein
MKIIKNYKFNKNLDLFFSTQNNIFFLKSNLGISYFYMPSYYFFLIKKNEISFIFLTKFFFKSFISHFFSIYSNLVNIFILRLKIKGLGYQIRRLSKNIYSFHFNYINFFYLFLPKCIIAYWYKKRLILISNNLVILKIIIKNILLLKKLGPYRLLGMKYPRQLLILKKGGKTKLK